MDEYYSPTGIFTLQLMCDLHPLFADQYLHCVDSDKILACEIFQVAEKTALMLESPELKTPKATEIYNGLGEDDNNNVTASIKNADGSTHTFTLMTKITRQNTLAKIKQDLLTVKAGGL